MLKRRYWLAMVTWAMIVLTASTAVADEGEYFEPTDTQYELNRQGLEALDAEDYDSATRFFGAALDLGESNVILVNLARAHQRAGDCQEAEKYYEKVFDAPAVETPAPEAVARSVSQFRDEMREECPGYLEVECEPPEIELYIDGQGPEACATDEPRELLPGRYELRGELDRQINETTVAIDAMQTSRVRLGLQHVEVDEPTEEAIGHVDPPPRKRTYSTHPGIWLAAGTAAFAGGLFLDTVPESANNGQLDATDFVPVAFYGVGITFGVFGIQRLRH